MLEIKLCENKLEKQQICSSYNILSDNIDIYLAKENGTKTGCIAFFVENRKITVILIDCNDIYTTDGLIRSAAAYAKGTGALELNFNIQRIIGVNVEKINSLGYDTLNSMAIDMLLSGCKHK